MHSAEQEAAESSWEAEISENTVGSPGVRAVRIQGSERIHEKGSLRPVGVGLQLLVPRWRGDETRGLGPYSLSLILC